MPGKEFLERLAKIETINIEINIAPPSGPDEEWVAGADNPKTGQFQYAMGSSADKAIALLLRVMAIHYQHEYTDEGEG